MACQISITHEDPFGRSIFFGELIPDAGELGVGRSTLANDGSVPPRVVVLEGDTE